MNMEPDCWKKDLNPFEPLLADCTLFSRYHQTSFRSEICLPAMINEENVSRQLTRRVVTLRNYLLFKVMKQHILMGRGGWGVYNQINASIRGSGGILPSPERSNKVYQVSTWRWYSRHEPPCCTNYSKPFNWYRTSLHTDSRGDGLICSIVNDKT